MYHLPNRSVSLRERIAVPVIVLALAIDVLTPLVERSADPSPADAETELLADDFDLNPIGNRTPLLLIHGIHGNKYPTPQYLDTPDSLANPYERPRISAEPWQSRFQHLHLRPPQCHKLLRQAGLCPSALRPRVVPALRRLIHGISEMEQAPAARA